MNQLDDGSLLHRIRHSLAHVLAQAVLEKFPTAQLGIGPATDDGFYYDFLLPDMLTADDLPAIEARMRDIVRANVAFHRREIDEQEARRLFAAQPFKLEIIDRVSKSEGEHRDRVDQPPSGLSTYRQDTFEDLCRGPHVESSSDIDPDAFTLVSVGGAYWRGDSSGPMLQRISGQAFETGADLQAHRERIEIARQRDHRRIGRDLDLFSHSPDVGPGLTLWHPKGAIVRYVADRFSQEAHMINGYSWVYTPHIGRANLWETSGHLKFYRDSMYKPIDVDGEPFYLKPMSCPFHMEIFRSRQRSYRELPIRFAEFATVYRYELSGTLQGLTRVRGFTQDDAHILCRPEQVRDEIRNALRFCLYVLRSFGIKDFKAYVATRPEEKYIGSDEEWNANIRILEETVTEEGLEYEIDEGGGAFYGPKIDLKSRDVLGREWQLSTVQFDFNLPERFKLEYTGSDGQPHRPVMVHRALFGSAERFFGLLIEHYGGAFPLWLAPVQAVILPVVGDNVEYAEAVAKRLRDAGMRVDVDASDTRIGARIREAAMQKVPFAITVGKREVAEGTLSVRERGGKDSATMTVEEFLASTADTREKHPVRLN